MELQRSGQHKGLQGPARSLELGARGCWGGQAAQGLRAVVRMVAFIPNERGLGSMTGSDSLFNTTLAAVTGL